MPQTRINCPNCRQPIAADVNQLFDTSKDPRAKQLILSGAYNLVNCPHCRYQGNLATPIVYHDPEKELLLTYFPPELGLPVNEQERLVGPMITQITNGLPQEKRKAYLFRPQTMFTLQSMVERILEADGITKEMIQEQQKRLELLQRLMDATDDEIAEITREQDALLDEGFFTLLARLMEAAMMGGDRESARRLNDLQNKLVPLTTFGRSVQEQSQEVQNAVQALKSLGNQPTREDLLGLLVKTTSDTQISVMVSLMRPAIDYTFFQILSDRIDKAKGADREHLLLLREHLLELTREIDREMEARVSAARELLQSILNAEDVLNALQQSLPAVDDFFMQAFQEQLENARQKSDLDALAKLTQIQEALQEASQPTEELVFIDSLMKTDNSEQLNKLLQENKDKVTPVLLDTLTSLLAQVQQSDDKDALVRLEQVYQETLRLSMRMQMMG